MISAVKELKQPISFAMRSEASLALGISCLILFQILDAVFTLVGIERFGLSIEGNVLVRTILTHTHPVLGMLAIKFIAIGMCLFLYRAAQIIDWIPSVVHSLNILYFSMAIMPWARLLF